MSTTIKASVPRGPEMWENSFVCPRCGGKIRPNNRDAPKDGLRLCYSCRKGDRAWREMVISGKFRPTTDEELEQLERELEELCREV